ncbi:AMP-binding protein [Pseudomonas sp. TTU2014-080ASC]|uniref:AMP-binding protein n=1 Tax=Pseudomonas sp. TTU2014-080ASC TaxID=1729724 RepID=UPI0007186FEF|nr:AMP-binding protein [Pseudomonas sp. TTU2014-080ASC]KRW59836.1 hypothetical protein AO726_13670 [Pseudomonas sp. TTU2014-080ASC]
MDALLLPTPTCNTGLAPRLGGFTCLASALDYAAEGDTGLNIYSSLGQLNLRLSYADLHQQALVAAQHLAGLGLKRGTRVGLPGETSGQFFTLFFACQYAGLVPCVLPFNLNPGGKQPYLRQLHSMLNCASAELLIAPQTLLEWFQHNDLNLNCQTLTEDQLYNLAPCALPDALGPQEMAYVQFSSGSTAEPKGILISQKAVCDNIDAILHDGMNLRSNDRAFSWLPMYHDMGLVGFFLAALCAQCTVDYLSPSSFAKRPSLWLQLMSANHSSITYAPAFAYHLAAERLHDPSGIDLTRLRIAGVGGEMIRYPLLETFTAALSPYGFSPSAWLPSYGMAENSLAIAIARPGLGARLSYGSPDDPRALVCCGTPLPGTQIRIVDAHGNAVEHGETGHIRLRSGSMMNGYLTADGIDTSPFDAYGFIDTGDLGYWHSDQLVISGRSKELIQVRGRNLWPQEIEWSLQQAAGLAPTDVAAFSVEQEDQEQLIVLVQSRQRHDPMLSQNLLNLLHTTLNQHFGINATIHLVAPRSLPLTTSGKLSRQKAREHYLQGEFSLT